MTWFQGVTIAYICGLGLLLIGLAVGPVADAFVFRAAILCGGAMVFFGILGLCEQKR